MPREVLEFRVVVASPNDLFETRKAIFEVIDELNRSFEIQKWPFVDLDGKNT